MSETTQEERDEWRARGGPGTWNGEHGIRLLNDADRLAEAEALLREARGWCPQTTYGPSSTEKMAVPTNCVRARIDAFLSGGE